MTRESAMPATGTREGSLWMSPGIGFFTSRIALSHAGTSGGSGLEGHG
jgi:hypothetical protein